MQKNRRCFRPIGEALESRHLLSVLSELNEFTVADEQRVLDMLGPDLLTLGGIGDVLDYDNDLVKLAARGYVPGHMATSFQGMGLAFGHLSAVFHGDPEIGKPTVLLYEPGPALSLTDLIPDPPYTLIGWAYSLDYAPSVVPEFGSFPADAWQVHEAGVHLPGGGFVPTAPPDDIPRGSQVIVEKPDGAPFGLFHKRLWNISFYRDPSGGPAQTGIHDPFGRVPTGHDSGEDSFFFPQGPFGGVPQDATHVEAEDFDMAEGYGWNDSTPGNRNGAGQYRLTDVDLGPTSDLMGGQVDVVEISNTDGLTYTVNVPVSGVHDLGFRFRNPTGSPRFTVVIDGVTVADSVLIPNTPGPLSYVTVRPGSLELAAGQHRVHIRFSNSNSSLRFNDFWMRRDTPTATLHPVPDVTEVVEFTEFTIDYRDNESISRASIDLLDVRVRALDGTFNASAQLVSAFPGANFDEITAVYRVAAPGGVWDPGDLGEYSIDVQLKEVFDRDGASVPEGSIGTFLIDVPFIDRLPVPREVDEIDLVIAGLDIADEINFQVFDDLLEILIEDILVERIPLKEINSIAVFANGGDDLVDATGVPIPFTIHGGDGENKLLGGTLGDSLFGGPLSDLLDGQEGDDLLDGGPGIDTMLGGPGDDKAVITRDRDFIDLGDGKDGLTVQGTNRADHISVRRLVTANGPLAEIRMNGRILEATYLRGETITVFGGDGGDTIVAAGPTTWSMEFFGEGGNDKLFGGERNDVLNGGSGRDVLEGGLGVDQYFAADGEQDHIHYDLEDILAALDPIDIKRRVRRAR